MAEQTNTQMKKTASLRLMEHILAGHGEWIAKVAACCKKKNCSKIEHKTMPTGK
jgi:hypothetical protein